ncbi:hypothetical protein As57867_009022, partial [Aphanomyces stellatus]
MVVLVAALLVVAGSAAASPGCSYGALPTNASISIIDSNICGSHFPCVVDRTCSVINKTNSAPYDYVGKYEDNSTTSLDLLTVNFSLAVLPNQLKYLTLSGGNRDNFFVPLGFSWPPTLTQVTLSGYAYVKASLPDSVEEITLRTNFFDVPSQARWPKKLKKLNAISEWPSSTVTLSTQFPDSLQFMSFTGYDNIEFSPQVKWPANLTSISYETKGALMYAPAITSTVAQVTLIATSITLHEPLKSNVQDLTLLSPVSPDNSMGYRVAPLRIEGIDASNVRFLRLGMPRFISNLKLGAQLKYINLGFANIDSWIMDDASFQALSALIPWGNRTSNEEVGVDYVGIMSTQFGTMRINTTQAACGNNGTLRELWPYRIPLNGTLYHSNTHATENKSHFMVCVTKSNDVVAPPSNTAMIVGLVATAVVVLGLTVFVIQRRRRQLDSPLEYPLLDAKLNMDALAMFRLEAKDFVMDKVLGRGAFADVWLALYQNSAVAVKKLHQRNVTLEQMESFVDEIKLMSKFDSPYIVKLVGAVWTRPADLQCVMEYMDGGDLRDYLTHHSPAAFHWSDKYLHIHSIVEGLVYLHSMDIIHRDLKSRNILLDSTKGTKLTDFGISKEDMQATMTMGVGTFRWMA